MQKYLIFIIIFGLIACTQTQPKAEPKIQPKIGSKIMDFDLFTIETPDSWRQIKAKGIDSYVGSIAINDSDILQFDLGGYSDDLTEYQEIILGDYKTYYISSEDTASIPTLVDSLHKDKVVKSCIRWDNIDGRRAKLLSPIIPGEGTTGIYFDSLWQAGFKNDKFNLYGTNLKPVNEKAVLEAFKTLKFHKPH